MPIDPPRLDDLTYDRTFEELKRRIPVYAPEWTNYNDSDPGITLLQLFSYLAEQVGYRLNRVPEKAQIALLQLLGVTLKPAHAASTTLALLLADPSTLTGYNLAAATRVKAKKGSPPPTFETDVDVDIVPAQPAVFVTTLNPYLYDALLLPDGTHAAVPADVTKAPAADSSLLTATWDGSKPKLKDMPVERVPTRPAARPHRYLWIGLNFNLARDAGFKGVRVSLAVQFDDDERPSLTADAVCGVKSAAAEAPKAVDWLYFFDADPAAADPLKLVPGRVDDTTDGFRRSGTVRFLVPPTIGPIPESAFQNLRDAGTVSPIEACLGFGAELKKDIKPVVINPGTPAKDIQAAIANFSGALTNAIDVVQKAGSGVQKQLAHPLDPKYWKATSRDRPAGWLRVTLPDYPEGKPPQLRMITFNPAPATNATTVNNELVGTADGTPGQQFTLAHMNVLAGTLRVAVQEAAGAPPVTWAEVDSLDTAGPLDRVYQLDREAGLLKFGDGFHGRIVPLAPGSGRVLALGYRYGGGAAGEVGVGALGTFEAAPLGLTDAVNVVAARGGRDSETLARAEVRARKELSTRDRAVTAGDFEWIALQTPGVRVARAVTVPLRRPLGEATNVAAVNPVAAPRCGVALPGLPAGLDRIKAYGAVSVVVVPDEPGPEPVPTPSFLRAVAGQLDAHRLVTTEVFVVPPQYARLCNLGVSVKGHPGYTRARLQDLVSARLAGYLNVLTGGDDGQGYPFGAQVHVADLLAQVIRTEGVERVETLSADFTRTKSNAAPRQGRLVLCPQSAGDYDRLTLEFEESVSVDVTTLTLTTVD